MILTAFRIWSVQCNGLVTAGIIDGPEFQFNVIGNDLVAQSVTTGAFKRSIKQRQDIQPIGLAVIPTTEPTATADEPRCQSPGQVAVVALNARPSASNGCGDDSFKGHMVPNLGFKTCCDGHDICFGNLSLFCLTRSLNPVAD